MKIPGSRSGKGVLALLMTACRSCRNLRGDGDRRLLSRSVRLPELFQKQPCHSLKSCENPMGNSIDKIADKFYISSVEPLGDKRRIDELGVTHILNGAEEHLYRQHGGRLQGITYKVMGWDDAVGQIILPQLREAADFIEQVAHSRNFHSTGISHHSSFAQGITGGGIIVHCAAGISRSTSCCLSYLMIKRRMSLGSSYKLVWDARENVRPNPGFWKQLRMLEKELVDSGVILDDSLKLGDDMKDRKAVQIIESLDSESRRVPAMGTSVSFSLQVEDAEEARAKLNLRHPSTLIYHYISSRADRTVNAAIGALIQNVEILSPSSLGLFVYARIVAVSSL
jgi:hypothetical protein